jgi:hypothetical protein
MVFMAVFATAPVLHMAALTIQLACTETRCVSTAPSTGQVPLQLTSKPSKRRLPAKHQQQHSQQHDVQGQAQPPSATSRSSKEASKGSGSGSGSKEASKGSGSKGATAAGADGRGTQGIPQHELKQLQSFLRKVCKWRGWQGGAYHITGAWHAVEAAAVTAKGGCWQQQFTGKQLTDANCDALLRVIDARFCAGKLLRRLTAEGTSSGVVRTDSSDGDASSACMQQAAAAGAESVSGMNSQGSVGSAVAPAASVPCVNSATAASDAAAGTQGMPARPGALRCRVVQSWDAAWLAYFDTQDNAIYVNCWRWAREVSSDAPINCEGVVCTSRLQMLMHTLAHELVHAVVFHLFPDIDCSSPAYTINSRHGPIFHLLNKQLFGHSSDALECVHVLPGRRA